MTNSYAELRAEFELIKKQTKKNNDAMNQKFDTMNHICVIPTIKNVVGELLLLWINEQPRLPNKTKSKKDIEKRIEALAVKSNIELKQFMAKANKLIENRKKCLYNLKELEIKVNESLKAFKNFEIKDMEVEKLILSQFQYIKTTLEAENHN
jgi:hypothetical protein